MATTNYSFAQLAGTDAAGYSTINGLINSIDTKLYNRIYKTGASNPLEYDVMVFTGTWANDGTGGYWTSSKVTADSLAGNAVTTGKILDANVTTAKIADDAVTLAKLANNSVNASKIVDGSIGTSELADGSVSAAKLDAGLTTQVLPAGMIAPFAGTTAPSGWLLCTGQAVSRTTYAGLFGIVGTTYGVGDGSTTFNVPDMTGRVPVCKSADAEFSDLGETGGVKSVTLSAAQSGIAAHSHPASSAANTTGITFSDPGHGHGVYDPGHSHGITVFSYQGGAASGSARGVYGGPSGGGTNGSGTGISIYGNTTGAYISDPQHSHSITVNNATATVASEAHTNLQPYITLNYIIKY